MTTRARCSDAELDELRGMHVPAALDRLGLHWKDDRTFVPAKDRRSARLHVDVGPATVELVHTGPKWFDRVGNGGQGKGGGGAIDLAMYLLGLNFKQAVARLRECKQQPPGTGRPMPYGDATYEKAGASREGPKTTL